MTAARPISVPPRHSSSPPSSARRPSPLPRHEDLNGGAGSSVRFRPMRLGAADLPDLVCRFRCDDAGVGPLTVLDVSATGFAATAPSAPTLPPGSTLESFELVLGDQLVWSGEATLVYGDGERLGGRFTSGVLDLQHLKA